MIFYQLFSTLIVQYLIAYKTDTYAHGLQNEERRFPVSTKCMTIPNPGSLPSSETEVNLAM
jgi:hypothetical protein